MNRKKIDELWHQPEVLKARAILSYYLDEDSEVIFVGSGEKYDSVPNRQAVTDMNADAKTLRIGTAWEYCKYCKLGLTVMRSHHYITEAQYLYDHYMYGKRRSDKQELLKLNYSPTSRSILMVLLPKSLKLFSRETPKNVFQGLLKYELANNKHKVNV